MKNKISFVGDIKLFYLNDYGKLHLPVENEFTSFISVELTEIKCNKIDSNGFCVSVFIEDMRWYLVVNHKCQIYIFTVEVIYGTPKIFTNSQVNC